MREVASWNLLGKEIKNIALTTTSIPVVLVHVSLSYWWIMVLLAMTTITGIFPAPARSSDFAEARTTMPATALQERAVAESSSPIGSKRLAWTEVAPLSAPNNFANHNSTSDVHGCIFLLRARALVQEGPQTMDCDFGATCLWLKLWSFRTPACSAYLRWLRLTLPILAVMAGGAETFGYAIAASKPSNWTLKFALGSLTDVLLAVAGTLVLWFYHLGHLPSVAWRMNTHEHDTFLAALTLNPRWKRSRTRKYKCKARIAVGLWFVSALARIVSLSSHWQEDGASWFEHIFEFTFFCLLSGVFSAITVKFMLACEWLAGGVHAFFFELVVEHDRQDLCLHKVIKHWMHLQCAVRC